MKRKRIWTDARFLTAGAIIGVLAVILVVLLSGGSITTHPPYKTAPRPTLNGTPLKAPPPTCVKGNAKQHVMGTCLPQPKPGVPQPAPKPTSSVRSSTVFASLEFVASAPYISGPDFSNNDPVPCGAWAAIAAHSRFAYLKSVEGTGFYDSTAQRMAACAKAHGLPVGGYDFQHVCGVSAYNEASFFVRSLYAQGLLGKGTLPPSADTEYGSGNCGGRSWLQTWVNTVYAQDGHVCPINYTGAWWWQPNIGSWWPTCNGVQLKSWVSGYGVSYPYMPAGIGHLDLWQFSDHGFNGYSYVDESSWHSSTPFSSFAGGAAPVPVVDPFRYLDRRPVPQRGVSKASEYQTVKGWDFHHCRNSSRTGDCGRLRLHIALFRSNIWHAVHTEPAGPVGFRPGAPAWKRYHRAERFAILTHRVH